jgi:FkbM family methyltransferase
MDVSPPAPSVASCPAVGDLAGALLHGAATCWENTAADDHADLRPSYCTDPTPDPQDALGRLTQLLADVPAFAPTYGAMDPQSRALMAHVLLFRALGRDRVAAPLAASQYREAQRRARELRVARGVSETDFWGWELDRFDLRPAGIDLDVETHAICVETFFLLGQYRLCRDDHTVQVEPGDVVIDAGACWGDTSLFFADLAGPDGRVLAMEFDAHNLEVCHRNAGRNPRVAERIDWVERALWDEPGQRIAYEPAGYGTRLVRGWGDSAAAITTTIDDLVAERDLDRVDFIKMDIEGAELQALRGAERTLREHRPKLAIAAYHLADDLATLPGFLLDLDVGYQLHLGHYTTHQGETVLYAR